MHEMSNTRNQKTGYTVRKDRFSFFPESSMGGKAKSRSLCHPTSPHADDPEAGSQPPSLLPKLRRCICREFPSGLRIRLVCAEVPI